MEEREYCKTKNYDCDKTKAQIINGAVCGIVMLLATSVYLIMGIFFGMWHPTWVAFPIGGVFCGISSIIVDTKENLKKLEEKNKNIEK